LHFISSLFSNFELSLFNYAMKKINLFVLSALLVLVSNIALGQSSVPNQWTWLKGSNALNQSGTYSTQGVANASNTPGARSGQSTVIDANGNLYLFGGYG